MDACFSSLQNDDTIGYGDIERCVRQWRTPFLIFSTAVDVATVVKGSALGTLSLVPQMCLESIEGISILSHRHLTDDEKNNIVSTLVCFGAIYHCARTRNLPLDPSDFEAKNLKE